MPAKIIEQHQQHMCMLAGRLLACFLRAVVSAGLRRNQCVGLCFERECACMQALWLAAVAFKWHAGTLLAAFGF
jgi:hypothetical protein